MNIGRNDLCPCRSGKKFKKCHGSDEKSAEELEAAIHETGHAVMLPHDADIHVSFVDPCPLCAGGDKESSEQIQVGSEVYVSRCHTNYAKDIELFAVEEMVYSVGSGAAEIACGLHPSWGQNASFEPPHSMVRDLKDLREELGARECLLEAEPYIQSCFRMAVEALRPHADNLLKLALRLIEQRVLVLRPEDLDFFDRNAFVLSVANMLGEDVLEQIKQKLSTAAPKSDDTPAQAPEPDTRIG
jgi:SEC-C motif-containing protein